MSGRLRGTVLATLAATISILAAATAAAAPPTAGVVYRVAGGSALRLDAYLPDGVAPAPAAVLLHGGGWTKGSRSDMAGLGRLLAERGIAAFAVDYRLAPAHPYPAALHDVQAAVGWIRDNAATYRVDPKRIGAFGLSAGGHLAVMAGVLGEGPLDRDARIRVAVAWSAPLDLARLERESAPRHRAAARSMIEAFVGCSSCAERLRNASPATHVDPTDAAVLLVNSAREPQPIAQASRLALALAGAGVPAELVEVPGTRHASYAAVVAGAESVLEASLRYLTIWFGQPRVEAHRASAGVETSPGGGLATALAVAAAITATVVLAMRADRDRPRRGWFDPAAVAMVDSLGVAGVAPAEIEARLRRGAPRPVLRRTA